MSLEVADLFGVVTREVGTEERDGKPARVVTAYRTYDTDIDDLWDAITNITRIPRWFSPVSGDLRLGGRYQVEGNAGGTITACDAPRSFASTWEFGGGVSWLEVELKAQAEGGTQLCLKHAVPVDEHWQQFGPGAVGTGWDLGLLGLYLHLSSGETLDPKEVDAWSTSDDGKRFVRLCAEDWGRAAIAAGDDAEEATAAAERTAGFYTGELQFEMPEA
jgi:uncharacterized protein YndB with AHSA1/START domain